MGKLRLMVLLIGFFLSISGVDAAWVQINTDYKTIAAVQANTTAALAEMELQNNMVNSIKKKQEKLRDLLGEMALYKGLIRDTQKNIDGFKTESAYFKSIVRTGCNIVNHATEAYSEINKSKLVSKINASLKVASLITDAVSLGQAFADIVANGKVQHPMKEVEGAKSGKGDGANLLNRHERLKLANDILYRMRAIDRDLWAIAWTARTSTATDLIRKVDRKGYFKAIQAKYEIKSIISQWNRLSKK